MLGRSDESIFQFEKVKAIRPGHNEAELGHALALMQQSKPLDALAILCRVLETDSSEDARTLFVQGFRSLKQYSLIAGLEKHLIAALTEAWNAPRLLAAAAGRQSLGKHPSIASRVAAEGYQFRLTRSDVEALVVNQLLLSTLKAAPVIGRNIERVLTSARRELLAIASEDGEVSEAIVEFTCALAQQCFINEYVFDVEETEIDQLRALTERFAAETSSPFVIAVIGCYLGLLDVPGAQKLLEYEWPGALKAVLKQQILEPRVEQELLKAIPRLTSVDSAVSLEVQRQYEENPYPRWVKIHRASNLRPLGDYLRKFLPVGALKGFEKPECDILVAGCGTGQQSLGLALGILGAKILAVDLSKASLAHAIRKTRELAVNNIEYAQADILKLGEIERTFDVIAAGGVLHHMADPFAAWRDLASRLRPGGLMIVGLYSAVARRDVAAARTLIANCRFLPNLDGIRRARQAIMTESEFESVRSVSERSDFYCTSECRDLLFHVQEHYLDLPQIKQAVAEFGFRFIGFQRPLPSAIRGYRARFPDDWTMTNLDNWHAYEIDNPRTFSSMYRFVVQKTDGGSD